jgi:putative PEP-CTERM system histidine kinase
MRLFAILPFGAALFSALLGLASVIRTTPSVARWSFCVGMLALALDSLCTGLGLRAARPEAAVQWFTLGLVAKTILPAPWLVFSLAYSRGDARESLHAWRIPLALLLVAPPALAFRFQRQLLELLLVDYFGETLHLLRSGLAARLLDGLLLITFVVVLMHLEQTFRSAVGTMRWRIKYVVLGLGVIFGAHIYVRSQAILFSTHDLALTTIESSGLLIGCVFLAVAYARTGLVEVDAYPSRAVLRSSITVLIVGGYLFAVGVLAQVVRRFGGAESFQFQALVVLVGIAGLAVLLLSDRLRQQLYAFVGRHFARAQHDSVTVWTTLSRELGTARDATGVCQAAARLVASTFEVLSVSVWLVDESGDRLALAASTVPRSVGAMRVAAALRTSAAPFEFEHVADDWAAEWRERNPSTFPANGGRRWAVPLREGDTVLGVLVLADRVNGAPYSREALDLLQCIGDQVASALQNLRLGHELAEARELEAFRTMSAFFVHDLKNAAASLNLMLKNLPVHFDDPAFRADALRGIGNTARRIDDMIARLGALRARPQISRTRLDLPAVVEEALDRAGALEGVSLIRHLAPTRPLLGDRDQLASVVSNLILNARDAVGAGGRIEVRTDDFDGGVSVSVADNGCGMSPTFIRDSLFRPFQSTKSRGLGVGMYQARLVVETHGGQIQVESEEGVGTTIRLLLPAGDA